MKIFADAASLHGENCPVIRSVNMNADRGTNLPSQRRHNEDNMQFRPACEADVPAMMELRLAVTENRLSDPGIVTYQMCVDYLHALGRGWVCVLDGRIVGFSYAATRDSSIWALFVQPGFEGRGIGKHLLQLAVGYLFSLGNEKVVLGTQADTRADRFYQMQGWQRGTMRNAVEVGYTLSKPGHP
jgi:GNAT superfamily N-acetyltransferase